MSQSSSDSQPPADDANRRREERLAALVVAVLEVRGEDRSALLRDLSSSGAMCLTRARLEPGQAVRLRIHTHDDLANPMILDGEVARAARWADGGAFWPYTVGIRFTSPAPEHLDRIREIADRQIAQGIVPPRS